MQHPPTSTAAHSMPRNNAPLATPQVASPVRESSSYELLLSQALRAWPLGHSCPKGLRATCTNAPRRASPPRAAPRTGPRATAGRERDLPASRGRLDGSIPVAWRLRKRERPGRGTGRRDDSARALGDRASRDRARAALWLRVFRTDARMLLYAYAIRRALCCPGHGRCAVAVPVRSSGCSPVHPRAPCALCAIGHVRRMYLNDARRC